MKFSKWKTTIKLHVTAKTLQQTTTTKAIQNYIIQVITTILRNLGRSTSKTNHTSDQHFKSPQGNPLTEREVQREVRSPPHAATQFGM